MEVNSKVRLDGKVCIVTGSGRGIGFGIARTMAAIGARVVVNDIDQEPLDAAVKEIQRAGGEAIGVKASVGSVEDGQKLTKSALDKWGGVDVLVNNAGITRDSLFHKMSEQQWDEIMNVHVKALFCCTQPVIQHLVERQKSGGAGGSIVSMSSTAGLKGNVGQANYSAAKAGVLGFTLALAKEMERFKVRVNAVAPSAWTRLTSAIPEEVLVKSVGQEGVDRMKSRRPEDLASIICFLASDAADGVTGQFVRAAGNMIGLWNHPDAKVTIYTEDGWTPDTVAAAFEDKLRPRMEKLVGIFNQ
ncbi:MAG: SDR family NAD(P)-dependent oxidoreductase [Nitrospirae bacterium]|nr:SDR family NAD(P)-dependent oxidoreductase [Nitrospirota bacterium]